MKTMFFIATLFLMVGCATNLNKQGLGVRVVKDAAIIKGCKYLQEVESSSSWGGFVATGIGYRSAMNELKNTAGEVGGDVVLLSTMANTMGGTNMSGSVYNCKN